MGVWYLVNKHIFLIYQFLYENCKTTIYSDNNIIRITKANIWSPIVQGSSA